MKKLFTTFALIGACAYAANAQDIPTWDIEVSMATPQTDDHYDNVAVGEGIPVEYSWKYNGPDDLVAGDTIFVMFDLSFVGLDEYVWQSTILTDPDSIPVGYEDVTEVLFIQGEDLADGGGIFVNYPEDTKLDEVRVRAYGVSPREDGLYLFNDPGTDIGAEGIEFSGNNIVSAYNIVFGDPSDDEEPNSILEPTKANQIKVYPNPTNNELNFAYEFDKVTTAYATVYDINGRAVITQEFGMQAPGVHNFTINVANLPNGTYTLHVNAEGNKGVSKFSVMK